MKRGNRELRNWIVWALCTTIALAVGWWNLAHWNDFVHEDTLVCAPGSTLAACFDSYAAQHPLTPLNEAGAALGTFFGAFSAVMGAGRGVYLLYAGRKKRRLEILKQLAR